MQQVATFDVSEQEKCNEFLNTVKPGSLSVSNGRIVIFYDDGSYPVSYHIVDLKEHLQSVRAATFQQQVALHVAKAELASLNPVHNKGRYQEVDQAIRNIEDAIQVQSQKEGFVLAKIKELEDSN